MTIEVGQDISSILGGSGSFTGDGNSLFAAQLASIGFKSEAPVTHAGEFNKSVLGIAAKTSEAGFAPKAAPGLKMGIA